MMGSAGGVGDVKRALSRSALCTAFAVGVVAVAGAVVAVATPSGAAPRIAPVVYAALGDSYSSGPLIVPQSDPTTCLRSDNNYAGLLARALRVTTFRDVTCSSATTQNFSAPQQGTVSGTAPPQYDAITPDTTLVTVGIGGNDIGLVGLAEGCINVAPPPAGQSCAAKYTAGGVDQYSQKIKAFAGTYGRVINHIHRLAPQAKILMVGYPTAIRAGGCYPVQPILAPDATYLQSKIDELNSAMRYQARTHGATYIDIRTSSVGHDACALPTVRWLEGLIPLSNSYPLHPNVLEMQNTEKVIAATLAG